MIKSLTQRSIKKDLIFSIYDRYGKKLHQADHSNGYTWDGSSGRKKFQQEITGIL
ncbi:hypothetical protein [Chryseobacterium phocaeense]|uniref:hypothetical protein n=1 Tax=Chryseobacterium phocaeense TaxID=1816690 RepID=UPI00160FFB43|nr:hypothetical protein [Chryseobacterium phocaeense]